MSDLLEISAAQFGDAMHRLIMAARLQDKDYKALLERYDDAMKRIADLTAELEYFRHEQGRRIE